MLEDEDLTFHTVLRRNSVHITFPEIRSDRSERMSYKFYIMCVRLAREREGDAIDVLR